MTPQTETQEDAVVREVTIAASPETVFEFFTDPAKMTQWKGERVTLDPKPGGIYRVELNDKIAAAGAYVVIDPPRRIVFTWGWEDPTHAVQPGTSTVEITLEPEGDGTRVRLVHTGLPEAEREPHGQGWDHFLPRLAIAAAGGDPGADPMGTMAE